MNVATLKRVEADMASGSPSLPPNKDHYPYVTRSLLRLMAKGFLTNVASVDVEPDYGYFTRLTYTDGSHRITYGNDLGLNPAAACDLAKDKGHSKFLLRRMGVNCPEGAEFLLPWWRDTIGPSQRARGNHNMITTNRAPAYVERRLGYPVYVKPVDGSKGQNIFKVGDSAELRKVLEKYQKQRVRVAVVEEPLHMPDYRLVVLDGELISAYQRLPLTVVGDGHSTIRQLIEKLQARYIAEGRDTRLDAKDLRIKRHLKQSGLTLNTVPLAGQKLKLVPISNLSAGGTSEDVTQTVNARWVRLAARIADSFNLRLIGLDLACQDITSATADYSVIEVNSAPGLDHYAMSGDAQSELVDQLYTKVLNAFPR